MVAIQNLAMTMLHESTIREWQLDHDVLRLAYSNTLAGSHLRRITLWWMTRISDHEWLSDPTHFNKFTPETMRVTFAGFCEAREQSRSGYNMADWVLMDICQFHMHDIEDCIGRAFVKKRELRIE